MAETIEGHEAEFIKDFLKEADKIQKEYKVSKSVALEILILLELKKIHSHLDVGKDV